MAETDKLNGGCLCGTVRFELDRASVATAHNCYCADCQRSTGSSMATFVTVPDAAFTLLQGQPKFYSVVGDSGGEVSRGFCPNCGSPLYSTVTVMPGFTFVKAGALDDSSWVTPVSSFWVSSARPWAHVDGGSQTFERNPTA